jgi:hypothetical protein
MSTTTNLALNEPAYNSTSPTWDQPLNYNSTILDQAFGSTTSVSVNTGPSGYTTIAAPSSTAAGQTSQCMRINLTGAISASQLVLLPQNVAGDWIVTNSTTGSFVVTLGSNNGSNASAGTTLAIPQGYSIIVYCDGTNVKSANDGLLNSINNLSVGGNLTVAGTSYFSGTSSAQSLTTFNIVEAAVLSGTAASGTINFYTSAQSVWYYNSSATGNWTLNVAHSSGTSLNSILAVNQSITIAFLAAQGSTPYYQTAFQIDGSAQTPKWQGGTAPTSGNANGIDVYAYTIIKQANNTYTVLASQSQFA